MDIDRSGLAESEAVAGKLAATLGASRADRDPFGDQRARARGRRFRRRRVPDRRLRSLHDRRFRDPQALRPAPDDRRHARRRRHHARRCGPCRICGKSARTCSQVCPRRDPAAIRQPDGDQHLGDLGAISRHPPGRPLPFRAGHGDGARARSRHCRSTEIRYRAAGINHMAFYLEFEAPRARRELARSLSRTPRRLSRGPPAAGPADPRCPNKVRYEMLTRLGYFVTESSEHFAEYTPWFIKRGREDLIEKFGIPLDEYPRRCVEQIERWNATRRDFIARPDASRSGRAANMHPRSSIRSGLASPR